MEFAGMSELLKVTDELPLTAANEAELPQFDNAEATGLASTRLAGNASVSAACVSAVVRSLFLMRIVNWLVCPIKMVLGEKRLFNVGARMTLTCNVALAGVVLVIVPPAPEEVSAPAGIVLIRFPDVVEVTSTETVHEPGVTAVWAGTVPPLNEKVVPPGTVVTLPPQVVEALAGLAMRIPG